MEDLWGIYSKHNSSLTPFSFSFPSILPNGTLPRPNNELLNANLLEEGFSVVIGRRGGLFSGVCCTCAAGGAVGSDGTSHPQMAAYSYSTNEKGCTWAVVPLALYQVWEIVPEVCSSSLEVERIGRG